MGPRRRPPPPPPSQPKNPKGVTLGLMALERHTDTQKDKVATDKCVSATHTTGVGTHDESGYK